MEILIFIGLSALIVFAAIVGVVVALKATAVFIASFVQAVEEEVERMTDHGKWDSENIFHLNPSQYTID